MALPAPEPGLVIRYAYLWRDEKRRGKEEGEKDRPCVVVNVHSAQTGDRIIRVAPITRNPPQEPSSALEIPRRVTQYLGLKDDRQWIVIDETNRFTWPGPDLRRVPHSKPGHEFTYGLIPGALFRRIRDGFVERAKERRDHPVNRDAPG